MSQLVLEQEIVYSFRGEVIHYYVQNGVVVAKGPRQLVLGHLSGDEDFAAFFHVHDEQLLHELFSLDQRVEVDAAVDRAQLVDQIEAHQNVLLFDPQGLQMHVAGVVDGRPDFLLAVSCLGITVVHDLPDVHEDVAALILVKHR